LIVIEPSARAGGFLIDDITTLSKIK